MKLNRILTLCAIAATLAVSTAGVFAQNNNNGGQRGPGGPGGPGGQGGRGGGNFDMAQMQERIMERYQEQLGFTNDAAEWDAVKPLVQKVTDARMAAMSGMGRSMFGGRSRGGDQGSRGGGLFGQSNPEADALQKAIDDNAPASQIKDLLARYKTAQKAKEAKLAAAQAELKAVLTTKQEAQATLMGLVE